MCNVRNGSTISFAILFVIGVAACPTGGDCVEAMAGSWQGSGTCFAMEMSNTATVEGCTVTFADWDMEDDVPSGAVIAGSEVTLTGEGWSDCTGTIADDGMSISGTCPDGCDFNLEMQQ